MTKIANQHDILKLIQLTDEVERNILRWARIKLFFNSLKEHFEFLTDCLFFLLLLSVFWPYLLIKKIK